MTKIINAGTNLKKRTKSSNHDVTETVNMWNNSPGQSPFIYYSIDVPSAVDRTRMVGFDIVDFHKRKREGQLLPSTPFTKYACKGYTSGSKDVTSTSDVHIWAEAPVGYILNQDWIITENELAAYAPQLDATFAMEAASKIYSSGYDALTFLGEFKETARMFVGIAKFLLAKKPPNYYNDRHNKPISLKGIKRSMRKVFHGGNSSWLSARYGMRPIKYDIIGLSETVKKWSEKRARYSDMSGTTTLSTYPSFTSVPAGNWWNVDTTITDMVSVGVRGSVTADIEIPKLQFNPLVTSWELLPYSFVIDWFLNVGKTLAAYSFLMRVKQYTAANGYRVDMTRSFRSENGDPGSIYSSGSQLQIGVCEASLEYREPCKIPYFPQFVLRLNNYKLVDIVGLVAQRLIRR